ncbi:uncharacterized protein LOC143225911 isoform X2 [Tachypleus tridentatus]|uniref:uncharacterized protein LOC143225911 isoform X2 n=1 Tax=Tachypleus tridentatus TaxID=6853 RepID=UPI003FD134AB
MNNTKYFVFALYILLVLTLAKGLFTTSLHEIAHDEKPIHKQERKNVKNNRNGQYGILYYLLTTPSNGSAAGQMSYSAENRISIPVMDCENWNIWDFRIKELENRSVTLSFNSYPVACFIEKYNVSLFWLQDEECNMSVINDLNPVYSSTSNQTSFTYENLMLGKYCARISHYSSCNTRWCTNVYMPFRITGENIESCNNEWTAKVSSKQIRSGIVLTVGNMLKRCQFYEFSIEIFNDDHTCNMSETNSGSLIMEIKKIKDTTFIIRNLSSGHYCARIKAFHPKCSSDDACRYFYHSFEINKEEAKKGCDKWNAKVFYEQLEDESGIRFFFIPINYENEKCQYKEFTVILFPNVSSTSCNYVGTVDVELLIKKSRIKETDLVFRNLPRGSHCIRINAFNLGCPLEICRNVFAPIEYPAVETSSTISSLEPEKFQPHWLYPVAGSVLGVLVVLILFISLVFRRSVNCKTLQTIRTRDSCIEGVTSSTPMLQDPSTQRNNRLQVFILYFHDSPVLVETVKIFTSFLRKLCEVDVVLDTEEECDILISPETWISKQLKYFCSKRKTKNCDEKEKKIILVESSGAVRCQKALCERKIIQPKDVLDLFCYGLSIIMANMESIKDYCHLMVIRFPNASDNDTLLNIVPGKRYSIPEHLVSFYLDLHDNKICHHSSQSQNILKKWSLCGVYKDLLKSVENLKSSVEPIHMVVTSDTQLDRDMKHDVNEEKYSTHV